MGEEEMGEKEMGEEIREGGDTTRPRKYLHNTLLKPEV